MGDNAKSDYEFIKEQIIVKKRNKLKKRLLRISISFASAVMFGLIAAVTFVLAEPTIYKLIYKENRSKPQISLPTTTTDIQNADITTIPEYSEGALTKEVIPETVIQRIDADLSDLRDMHYELRKMAYKVNKAIVKVNSTFLVEDWFNNTVEKTVSTTGLIITETPTNFYILVSLDRVKGADRIKLKFFDTVYVNAWLIDYEEEINIAIITVYKEEIPSIYLSGLDTAILGENYSLVVGNPVVALGSPNGYPNSMGFGIITSEGSSVAITDNILKLFNTDIADNPDSDGVIVNTRGEVIGLITRTLKYDQNKNNNTAISIEYIKPYIVQMINQNERLYFGIRAKDMTEDAKQAHNVTHGIYVDDVIADSPAFKGNIKNGDIILNVDGNKIINTNYFYKTISRYKIGSELKVKIKRTAVSSEQIMDMVVTLDIRQH